MKKTFKKRGFPADDVRRFLEPGPVVLISSAYKGERNVMTCGWHMIMAQSPSLVGCIISDQNHSFELIRKSRECVINLPTVELAKTVVSIGNCSGRDVDKLDEFGLTTSDAHEVAAPLIDQCYASFECHLHDPKLIKSHGLFVFEVIKAHAAVSPRLPKTIHYRGDGLFMVSGPTVRKYRKLFRPEML